MTDGIKLILGTMTFGPQVGAGTGLEMVKRFLEAGYREVDTAHVYNEGETETMLGPILAEVPEESLCLATKVNPRVTGRLDGRSVTMQFNESLRKLGRKSADILYLHVPDPCTPVEETLGACAALYDQGKFKELGLSNFPAWMVVDIWHLCKERGWPKPGVYQGLYNGLSRKIESELFPALRSLGMRFYAYNPLAGGMLSGRYRCYGERPAAGRFARLQSYRNRYWKKSYFDALNRLVSKCADAEIEPAEAAFRWLACHSQLASDRGDGIIVGASSMMQFEQNLAAPAKGPLPGSLLSAFNTAWEETKSDSPDYFYYYRG
jgi:aflatoxin B1 aldehyde reductase